MGLGSKERPRDGIFGVLPARSSLLPNSKETLATQAMKEFARFTLTFVFTALEMNGYSYFKLGKIEIKFLSYAQRVSLL